MELNELFKKKLGFGAMRLPGADKNKIDHTQVCQMFDAFLERGFNYFDTAHVYAGSEVAVRKALVERHPRDSFILTDKLPPWGARTMADYEKSFNESLERCGVDYFDIYLVHNMGITTYDRTHKIGGFDFVSQKKAEGKVKFIGFSFHDTPEMLERILTEHPEIDVVQLQINYADWENPAIQSRACYEVARRHNKPIIVMEPVKGGGLANLPAEAMDVLAKLDASASAASYAVRYAASLEGVVIVLSGMSDMAQVENNTSYMVDFAEVNAQEAEAIEKVREILANSRAISCTNCRYCVKDCPMDIPIPELFGVYNGVVQYGTANFPDMLFALAVKNAGKPSSCIECGKCEDLCPQHLPIRENLKLVTEMFEK